MSYYHQFIDFIMGQPKNRPIDHTNGWVGCAVGDFARECLRINSPLLSQLKAGILAKECCIHPNNNGMQLYNWLASSGENEDIRQYGDLQHKIEASRGTA